MPTRTRKCLGGRAAAMALMGLGVLLSAPAPARAQSCDARLYSRRAPQREVYRLGQSIDFAVYIDRNGSGCSPRSYPRQVRWSARHDGRAARPLKLRARKRGGAVSWRFAPRRAGVYVIEARPQKVRIRRGPSVVRHELLVLDPARRSRIRHGVRFRVTAGPGLRVRSRNTLRLLRVHRRRGGSRPFVEPWTRVRWRAGRPTRAVRLPPGEYLATAPLRPGYGDLKRRFKVHRAATVALDFTAVQVALRLGWTPPAKQLTAILKDALGVRQRVNVSASGVATFTDVAAGVATLRLDDQPRKTPRSKPSPPTSLRKLRTYQVLIPRAKTHVIELPAVYLYTRQSAPTRTTDWTQWPGLSAARGAGWSRSKVAPPAVRSAGPSAIAGSGKRLVALGRSLERTDGRRWWSRARPKLLRRGRPRAIAMIDSETWAWVDAGYRLYGHVTYHTQHGLSQEVLSLGGWCAATDIAVTAKRRLVIVGRCRSFAATRAVVGFLAVRGATGFQTVKLKVGALTAVATHGRRIVAVGRAGAVVIGRPGGPWRQRRIGTQTWRAVAATAGGIWLGSDQGLWKLPLNRGSRAQRIKLPWTSRQAPHSVRGLTPIPGGGLLVLFGPSTSGSCPRHQRSRLAQYRRGRWTVLHTGYARICTRCHIAGGRCTPHPGSVVLRVALLGRSVWGIVKTPPVRAYSRGRATVQVRRITTLR